MNSHFGNPLLEQRKLLEGNAILRRSDQSVVAIDGAEALKWLHALTSQNLVNLVPGQSAETLILDPKGHVEFQLKVIALADAVRLVVDSEKRDSLISYLQKMRFRTKVEIRETQEFVVGAFAELEIDAPVWRDTWGQEPKGSVRYAAKARSFPYREYLLSQEVDLGLPEAGMLAFEALRIAAARPLLKDTDEKTLPHEMDWLQSAVHLTKGCYRGQETVSKVHNLGHPPRRLALLHLDSGDVIANKGEVVTFQGKPVGTILAGALHFELGSIALALLGRITPYANLEVAGVGAEQEVVVPADAGKAANLPRPSAFKLSGKK